VQTIEGLESRLSTQLKNNLELETRVEGMLASESMREWDDELPKPPDVPECNQIVLEWYDKCYPIHKDRINEEDSWKLIRRKCYSSTKMVQVEGELREPH